MRSDRSVIAFLAFLSVVLAFGIDASLPAFEELRVEFDLSSGSGEVSLIVTSYFLGMASGQLLWGLLSDRFGRKPALIAGLTLYAIGAAGAAIAGTMGLLLFARFVWGVGAASPSVLRNSIARDLYSGDRLARITSLTMAIFLIGPAIAPSVGELILLSGSWRWVFASGMILGFLGIVWTIRFGETLAHENVRKLDRATITEGARVFFTNRRAFGFSMAITLGSSAFFVYLGSGQPIIDEIYGYGDWFALVFAAGAAIIGIAVLTSGRIIVRVGSDRVARTAALSMVAIAAVFLIVSLATDGRPPFLVWFFSVAFFGAATTVSTPAYVAMSMTPMSRVAGIASGINGLLTIGVASILAAIIDRQIDDSVTPMALGFLVYASLAFAAMRWARGGSEAIVEPRR